MDFYKIITKQSTRRSDEFDYKVYPKFNLITSKDILVRGGTIWGFWYNGKWNNNEYELYSTIDLDTNKAVNKILKEQPDKIVNASYINDSSTNLLRNIRQYYKDMQQLDIDLDAKILFSDHQIVREDYATFKLSYFPEEGVTPFFDLMFNELYDPEELEKILWVIGCVASGRTKEVNKMLYLFGEKQTGKGTVLDLMKDMFDGYYKNINLGELIGKGNHGTEQVRNCPILIDEDSNVSKGTNLEHLMKMVSHEPIIVNPKGKSMYPVIFEGVILTASNTVIKMPNVDHGMVRRPLIVHPSGRKHEYDNYIKYKEGIKFEHSAIVYKAIEIFNRFGPAYYDNDNNTEMLSEGNIIHAFVEEHYAIFKNGVSLNQAAELYKIYLEDYGLNTIGYKRELKSGLNRYYKTFSAQKKINGKTIKNYYEDFKTDKITHRKPIIKEEPIIENVYIHGDDLLKKMINKNLAQYTNEEGFPLNKWANVDTPLYRIDTSKLHYVKLDKNHIVIDFDLKKNGIKSLEENLKAASIFPETYGELSKSGAGIHLHYIYDGDVDELSSLYSEDIEIKVFKGNASLRRKFKYSNGVNNISTISGLPLKEKGGSKVEFNSDFELTEKILRTMIIKNLNKEYHASTASSIDYIKYLVDLAVEQDITYDINDLKQRILIFAMLSTNQSNKCIEIVNKLQYNSVEPEPELVTNERPKDHELVFYDLEVKPNLVLLCYGNLHEDGSLPTPDEITAVVNPDALEIEAFVQNPIVGFNNRRYDNHILYGRMIGESLEEVYNRSHQIIKTGNGLNVSAYGLSYADIYDYNLVKQSLSKWEIENGGIHQEYEGDWDEPATEEEIPRMIEYCKNDVIETMRVFNKTYVDYQARCVLADISGLPVNSSTTAHTAKIIFGDDKQANEKFVYTDLSKEFPGYMFDGYRSSYKGVDPSEGGYVYSEPGHYKGLVRCYDVESEHPRSLIAMNYFGPYTKNYEDLVEARLDIKHNNLESAGKRFGGILKPYLDKDPKSLSEALKRAINIVYGMSSAKFDNIFKHKQNQDNIVAKRGALFMIDLKEKLVKEGYIIIHIKTDSIKVFEPDDRCDKIVEDFGKKYQYTFDVESEYQEFWLVNKAVYVGFNTLENKWDTVGAQFQQPYIRKSMFTKEAIDLEDLCITKAAKGKIYLNDKYIGKVASIYPSKTGYECLKLDNDKYSHVTGTKGYLWKNANDLNKEDIDMLYFEELKEKAQTTLDSLTEVWR